MRLAAPPRASEIARPAGIPSMSPSRAGTLRLAWRALVGWSTRTPVGHSPTGSSGRQPEPEVGARGTATAAGPGGGAVLWGHRWRHRLSSRLSSRCLPLPQIPASTASSKVNAGHRAQLPALIATLPSPDREIALLGVVAGVSIPAIVATLAVTPAAVHRALSALQPAATANGSPPAARQRIVLLPHARTASADGIVRLAARVLGRLVTWWRSMGWWMPRRRRCTRATGSQRRWVCCIGGSRRDFLVVLPRSDGVSEFGEDRCELMPWIDIHPEFVVAASEVLDERVSGTDHPC
jgi:hypothetical protein